MLLTCCPWHKGIGTASPRTEQSKQLQFPALQTLPLISGPCTDIRTKPHLLSGAVPLSAN